MKKRNIIVLSLVAIAAATFIVKSVNFINPSGVLKIDRKMETEEIIRAIRLSISAEYEAVQLYTQVAESSDNPIVKKVFTEIANEERVHAGEFLRLLKHLDPEEEKHYQKGYKEVEEEMEKLEKENKKEEIKKMPTSEKEALKEKK